MNWKTIEEAPVWASALGWRQRLDPHFEAVAALALRRTEREARSVPCPDWCCGGHRVVPVRYGGSGFVGVCDDDDPCCEDLRLTTEQVTVWELDERRLGRAVMRALGCEWRDEEMAPPRTRQIGAFSGAGMPVVLTLPREAAEFRQAVMEMTLRLREHFILLAPTSRFMDATCHGILKTAKAGFFDLGSLMTLEADGSLRALRTAGELFTPYLPGDVRQRNEDEPPAARNLFMKAGSVWRVVFDGCPEFHIEDTLGAKYLDYLVHQPNQPIRAFALEQEIRPEKAEVREGNSIQKTVDAQTKREARQELVVLNEELEEAEADGHEAKAERLRGEMAKIQSVAGNESLLGGDTGERARDNVRKTINKVIAKLRKGSKGEQALGVHLQRFVSLGYEVEYNQPESVRWG